MSRPERLDDAALAEWERTHGEWRVEDGHLIREIVTTDYQTAVRIVQAQVDLCERLDHHPVVTVGYRTLRFELWTHDRDGLTDLDLAYATGLDEILREQFAELVD